MTQSSSGEFVALDEPAPGQTRAVVVGETKVLICNVDGELFAVENQCTHARVLLTSARMIDGEIECPVHGARFDAKSGAVMCAPARRGLRTFAVTRADGGVTISLES
ncbi:MAG: 3-phenylpropionate/trans-cinnamate dioxygenase ferredoxin subunit [Myxococcota bacterium]